MQAEQLREKARRQSARAQAVYAHHCRPSKNTQERVLAAGLAQLLSGDITLEQLQALDKWAKNSAAETATELPN